MVTYRNPPPSDDDIRESSRWRQKYIGCLEEERKKILAFQRELPLSLQLVTQAIERCRQQQQASRTIADCFNGQSINCTELQISPVLEEYIPMKPTANSASTNEEEEEEDKQLQIKQQELSKNIVNCAAGKDWLTSAQLSIQTPTAAHPPAPPIQIDLLSKKLLDNIEGINRNDCSGGFHDPLQTKNKNTSDTTLRTIGVETSSSADTDFGGSDGGGGGGDKAAGGIRFNNNINKKERRCWSTELHRRFLHALQQLGGAHVATPKQIKESMKVDGLTNDEIKSHLQKYRLHTRRLNPPPLHNVNEFEAHMPSTPHQLLLVGRIWMPPPPSLDYTTKTASSRPANGYQK